VLAAPEEPYQEWPQRLRDAANNLRQPFTVHQRAADLAGKDTARHPTIDYAAIWV